MAAASRFSSDAQLVLAGTDQELQPPREWELESIPPRLLMDALETLSPRNWSERNVANPAAALARWEGNTLAHGTS